MNLCLHFHHVLGHAFSSLPLIDTHFSVSLLFFFFGLGVFVFETVYFSQVEPFSLFQINNHVTPTISFLLQPVLL